MLISTRLEHRPCPQAVHSLGVCEGQAVASSSIQKENARQVSVPLRPQHLGLHQSSLRLGLMWVQSWPLDTDWLLVLPPSQGGHQACRAPGFCQAAAGTQGLPICFEARQSGVSVGFKPPGPDRVFVCSPPQPLKTPNPNRLTRARVLRSSLVPQARLWEELPDLRDYSSALPPH